MFEYDFQNENSHLNEVKLTGKVDRMAIDEKHRKITVVDYKTGRSYTRWQPGIVKLHLFQRQLMFYKLLIESSNRYKNYEVEKGIIEFVEPDEKGKIRRLEFNYDKQQLDTSNALIKAVWAAVQTLKFPDTAAYPASLTGIKKFEKDLINPNKNTG
jgi:hypothetical protein